MLIGRVGGSAVPVAASVLAVALAACGGGAAPRVGSERAHCYPNDTCDEGLTCLSTFCVRVTTDGGGPAPTPDGSAAAEASRPDLTAVPDGGPADTQPTEPSFTPAPHPALPQVGSMGGPVLAHPRVQPIIYADDDNAADIQAFLAELERTPYWSSTTSEYGVGALSVLPAIRLPSEAPASTTDVALRFQLAANTSGVAPAWGAADSSTIYLFVIPDGATVDNDTTTCCSDFGGYHDEASSGATSIPYAVTCSCPGFLGNTVTALDERTVTISHELVEAATDPFPDSNPAFQVEDRADIVWSAVTGGEVADMCEFNDDAVFVPPGSTYMVQRTWSNNAARAANNPCVPYATTAPYFNAFPVLDEVPVGTDNETTRGVSVPLGGTRTIDVQLFSAGPLKGPFTVSAVDYDAWVLGAAPALELSLDKTEGQNGDVLHLSITPQRQDETLKAEVFILVSHFGGVRDADYQTNLAMGVVTN